MSRRKREDGAAAVEFALVLPLLLLILFGIITYGMIFAQSLSLSNSARQAARSGVVKGTTCAQITSLAKDSADTLGMDGANTTITIKRGTNEATAAVVPGCGATDTTQPCTSQPVGTNVYVRMNFAVQPIFPLVPVPSQVQGKGVFRCEFS